MTSCRQYS